MSVNQLFYVTGRCFLGQKAGPAQHPNANCYTAVWNPPLKAGCVIIFVQRWNSTQWQWLWDYKCCQCFLHIDIDNFLSRKWLHSAGIRRDNIQTQTPPPPPSAKLTINTTDPEHFWQPNILSQCTSIMRHLKDAISKASSPPRTSSFLNISSYITQLRGFQDEGITIS